MTALDSYIRGVFGQAFGSIYGAGTLVKVAMVSDGKGGWTETRTEYPVKCQRDRATEGMKETAQRGSSTNRAGYTGRDCKLFVLQAGVTVVPDTDDVVIFQGRSWAVSQVSEDPAASHWTMYGVEVRTALPGGGTGDTGGTV